MKNMARYYFAIAIFMLLVVAAFFGFQYRSYTYGLNAFQNLFDQSIKTQAKQVRNKAREFLGWEYGKADTNINAQIFSLELSRITEQKDIHSICIIDENDRVVLDPSNQLEQGDLYPLEIYREFQTGKPGISITRPVKLAGQYFIAAFFKIGEKSRCVMEVGASISNSLSDIKKRFLVTTVTGATLLLCVGVGIFLLFHNLRRAEERMLQRERLAIIGEMSATIAHEIKNPLGIMRTSAQLLEGAATIEEGEKRALGYIISEVDRLDRKVKELLQFSRGIKPAFEAIEICKYTQKFLENYRPVLKEKDIKLETNGLDSECNVKADRDQIVQVLHNIVQNAIDSMSSGGLLRVSVSKGEGICRISVSDQGSGIPKEERDRIFEPFYTKKHRGTGLGLALCKRIIEAHNGKLYLGDCENGCIMNVELPLEV